MGHKQEINPFFKWKTCPCMLLSIVIWKEITRIPWRLIILCHSVYIPLLRHDSCSDPFTTKNAPRNNYRTEWAMIKDF